MALWYSVGGVTSLYGTVCEWCNMALWYSVCGVTWLYGSVWVV